MAEVRSPMVADVGARIRSLRTAKGLTQAQVAEPQYTKAYISMLESGRTRASMKALEHIAGVLGVQPADLLGGAATPATPQYTLLEARRLLEQRKEGAIPLLEGLEEGLTPQDQLIRLRYLAVAYNVASQPKQAFPVIERAQRMADLLNDPEEQIRIKAVLAAAYARTYSYEEEIRLLRECVKACEEGTVKDVAFHYRRLVDLALALGNQRQSKQALVVYEQAFDLATQFDDLPSMASLYAGIAKAYHDTGDVEAAIMNNQKSLDLYEQLGLIDQMACALDNAAALYVEYGNVSRARECLARATGLAEQARRDGTLASIKASEAEVLAKADPAEALEAAQAALKFARKVDQVDAEIRMLVLTGELRMKANAAASRRSFQEARQLAEERAPQLLRVIFDRWSRAAEATGDSDEALRLARRALETVRV
ncbi:MAG TPA: tetratricopeptide repeat protein [Candidatus Polarisedimenticolia bacterium]|nr:tetratricopeptide repeat protein [Candidatus Polarisedimenticolia bacterium]